MSMHAPSDSTPRDSAALAALATLAALLLAGASQAGPLADPTRPPATMATPAAASSATATGQPAAPVAARAALAAASAPAAPVPALLQSVQLPVRGPAVAMVDGLLVKAGDMVGKRMVLSIDSQGLVLRGDTGNQRLWLIDGNAKQAPGSITTTRTASFVPAPRGPDPSAEIDATTRPERNSAGAAAPAAVGTLSLAGRTQP
jgi:hypothetical protein